jgi:nitroreductase
MESAGATPADSDGTSVTRPDVVSALRERRSVRGFRPDPVDRATIESVLAAAAGSPSAGNTQPWRVHACAGEVRDRLSRDLLSAHAAGGTDHVEEYPYYPSQWRDPYLARRRQVGKDLYRLLGVAKGDADAMARQYGRNYEFFGAPVGLFFTLDRRLDGQAAWLDLGMYLHGVMLAAVGHGLATCAQQAFARYHKIIRRHLDISDDEIVVCGMSIGHPDADEPANRLATAREPVSQFARLTGF